MKTKQSSSDTIFLPSVLRLLVTANVVSNSPILVTLMMEAIRSSETSVLRKVTRRNIQEDGILNWLIGGCKILNLTPRPALKEICQMKNPVT
jgi:hypothetical protein